MTHDHYHWHRGHRIAHEHEHPPVDVHDYWAGVWPDDTEFHPRPPSEPDLDICARPGTVIDASLIFELKQTINAILRQKGREEIK